MSTPAVWAYSHYLRSPNQSLCIGCDSGDFSGSLNILFPVLKRSEENEEAKIANEADNAFLSLTFTGHSKKGSSPKGFTLSIVKTKNDEIYLDVVQVSASPDGINIRVSAKDFISAVTRRCREISMFTASAPTEQIEKLIQSFYNLARNLVTDKEKYFPNVLGDISLLLKNEVNQFKLQKLNNLELEPAAKSTTDRLSMRI